MSIIVWLDPDDCDPPHGLDLTTERDFNKVYDLTQAFKSEGFDRTKAALVGYPLNKKIQLLSGTHRHAAAKIAGIKLPVTLWLSSDIEKNWGLLESWSKVMKDISVLELEKWTRKDLEVSQKQTNNKENS